MEAPDIGPMPRASASGLMGGATARCVPAVNVTHAAMIAIAKTVLADDRVMGVLTVVRIVARVGTDVGRLLLHHRGTGSTRRRGERGEKTPRPPRLRVKRFSSQQLIKLLILLRPQPIHPRSQ